MAKTVISKIRLALLSAMRPPWRKALIGSLLTMLFLLLWSPELAVFSFWLDSVIIDAILIFAGYQLAYYWAYLKFTFLALSRSLRAISGKKP